MSPRLPTQAVPRHYEIELAPDLASRSFTGSVAIEIDIVEEADEIVCNAAELEITGARLRTGDATLDLDASLHADSERLTLRPADGGAATSTASVPSGSGTTSGGAAIQPGAATLEIEFNGVLNERLRGLYASTYTDDDGVEQVIAATQFESTDARRAFPCWDEPALKATFSSTLIVADGLLAVSNTAETDRTQLADGRVRVGFAKTMKMSTYLVAYVVGNLEATEPVDCNGVPVRVIHRPGRGSQTAFALDVAAHALRWFSDYYDMAYPSDKVDLVALPDFASGAMENLGCITFREVLLLVEPGSASQPELQRVADVINHELAHMWFGDLVTMDWWEGIWLNEAFATFMETACSDAYRPDWKVWWTFCRARAAALATDALDATRPLEYPVITPDEAEDMFDVITYEKGAALVRMLEQYLGEETFRDGVRLYLRRHAHANTVTDDLWNALGEAAGEPVREIMDSWIHAGGYPALTASTGEHGVEITQRHFTLDPSARADERLWSVPVRLRMAGRDGNPQELRVLLDGPSTTLTLPAGGIATLNCDAAGFYRSVPSAASLTGLEDLSAPERHGVLDDAWAFTLTGEMEASAYLDLALSVLVDERDLIVWQAFAGSAGHIRRLLDGEAAGRYGELVVAASDAAATDLGLAALTAADDDGARLDDRMRELRATLLRVRGATAADPATIKMCRELLDHPDPTIAAAALTVTAIHGDADHFAEVKRRFETATDPQTEQRHLAALADFADSELMLASLAGTLDGTVRAQDGPYLLRRALANHRAGATAWEFLTQHWERLTAMFPVNSVSRMLAGVTALDMPDIAESVHAFLEAHPVPQGAKQVAQHLERMDVNVAMRERESQRLSAAILSR